MRRMKNIEKYKTVYERTAEFEKYCKSHEKCAGCGLINFESVTIASCAFAWLDLEAEEEKPMDCPFCGRAIHVYATDGGGKGMVCDNCGYSPCNTACFERNVKEHNRICRAVKEAKEGEVKHEAN